MKKILSIISALIIVCSLTTGCTSDDSTNNNTNIKTEENKELEKKNDNNTEVDEDNTDDSTDHSTDDTDQYETREEYFEKHRNDKPEYIVGTCAHCGIDIYNTDMYYYSYYNDTELYCQNCFDNGYFGQADHYDSNGTDDYYNSNNHDYDEYEGYTDDDFIGDYN